jgi:glycosyltransferase involved in cell wall biosynthesis
MSAGKILFFRIWSGPPIAASVEAMLRNTFAEYDIQTVTLWDRIKADKKLVLRNAIAVINEYGWDILFLRLKFKTAFFRTTYLFKRVHSLAAEIGKQYEPVSFTFQLQSIFDTSIDGIPNFVYTDHTHLANLYYAAHMRVRLFSAEWISCEKKIYDHACMLFTRSTNISQSLVDQYGLPPEKVAYVFVGPNTEIIDIQPAKKDYAPKHILFVGLDWERKGGPGLLAAFERVVEDHPDASLTVVGCQVAGSHPEVRSVGKVSVDRLRQYYKEATIFCMPSLVEPFGVVFVEAMAYALPIVGTAIGAIPDMVQEGKNGFLVAPGDVSALAEALDRLLADQKLRERCGKESHRVYINRYNWQSVGTLLRKNILKSLKEPS